MLFFFQRMVSQKIIKFLELVVDLVTVTPHPNCSYGKSAKRKQKRDWRLRREIPSRSVGGDSQAQRDYPQAIGRRSGGEGRGKRSNSNPIISHKQTNKNMGDSLRRGDSHLRYIGAQVSQTLKKQVERMAKRQDMSVSQLLRRELKEMVASK